MKTYTLKFHGREVGAIGAFSDFSILIEAESAEVARRKLYETHEHIRGLSITPEREAYSSEPLNARERATITAALRRWQEHLDPIHCNGGNLRDIATDCGTLVPLSIEEINALCMALNR